MKRFLEVVRGLASLVVTAGLLVALPVLLGPWTISRFQEAVDVIDDSLASDSTRVETFLTAGLLLVFWLAWIMLVAAIITESVALTRGRAARRLPLLPGIQMSAARLVASCALVFSSFSSSIPATAVAAPIAPLSITEQVVSAEPIVPVSAVTGRIEAPTGPSYEVRRGDTWWSLGERFLGDGMRWGEVVAANAGATMPDGAIVSVATQNPVAGWTLRLPDGVQVDDLRTDRSSSDASTYTVRAGDGMWNVAEALLGDGTRHVELRDHVIGQEVAPGVVFTADTHVIHEGWTFTYGTVAEVAVPDDEPFHVVATGDTLAGIAEEHLGDGGAWPSIFEANAGRDMGDGRTFDDPDLIVPGWKIALTGEEVDLDDSVDIDDDEAAREAPAAGDLGTFAVPSTERSGGPQLEPPVEAAAEVVLSPIEVTRPFPPPTVRVVDTAPPMTSTPGLPLDDAVGTDASPASSPRAPSPVRLEHAALLAAGLLTLVGVRRRQRLRSSHPRARVPEPPADVVATERRLRTIDAGERAARIDIAIRATAHAVTDLGIQVAVVTASLDGTVVMHLTGPATLPPPWVGKDSTWRLDASIPIETLAEPARRVNTPIVALVQIGVASDGGDVLVDLEACGTFAVEARPDQADEVITAIAAGLAASPYAEAAHLIGVDIAPTALLGHRNAVHVGSLAAGFDMATSLVGSTAAKAKTTFALRALHTGGEMWEPAVVLATSSNRRDVDSPDIDLPSPGHGVALVASVGPGMAARARGRLIAHHDGWSLDVFDSSMKVTPIGVNAADLSDIGDILLDADSPLVVDVADASVTLVETGETASVFEPLHHEIVVRLLGPIEVRSRTGDVGKFERSKTVELIAWLATHREKSTRSAARTALWELDVRDATFANVVSEARRALARMVLPPDGEEWVARTLTDQLPVHDLVVTDAQLIRQRLEASQGRTPIDAISILRPAAEMIVDMPFAGTNYLWPDAEGLTSNLVLLATGVTTALAAHALSLGDTDLVFWATGQGLAVLPGHEELIGLRMRAHARTGDLAGIRQEWESYERVIVADAWSDGEPSPKLLALRRELLASS